MGWKLDNGRFYINNGNDWQMLPAQDIYWSAFGGSVPDNTYLSQSDTPIKQEFPNIRFSKFNTSLDLCLILEDGKIKAKLHFVNRGKEIYISGPFTENGDNIVVDDKWFYFSGYYQRIFEYLKSADIHDCEAIAFSQYVALLKYKNSFSDIKLIDSVGSSLSAQIAEKTTNPGELNATLYPYQTIGFQWLKYITSDNCGCILGDEMGLGKTLQVIAVFVERAKTEHTPFLVVAPLSLLENWRRELKRFAPHLTVLVHHGPQRTGRYKEFFNYDVVITSYGGAVSDLSIMRMLTWDILVLDEAQSIKTPDSQRTRAIKEIPHRASIAVTGTPFENHITDIWSIIDFAMPGCLGELSQFKSNYEDNIDGAEKIEPLLTALMLRRKVSDVAKDLPDKVIIPQPLQMNDMEAELYDEARLETSKVFESSNATLAILTKLRMFCTHPFLMDDIPSNFNIKNISTKYTRCCEILEEIFNCKEKVIIFTSYSKMFDLFESDIKRRFGVPVKSINGNTPPEERQSIVDEFSSHDGSAVLVLNPRAAGTGLNITSANHVIHYNLEWNPALEDQATARAYRRGQNKTVFVYRLFYADTVEELVNEKLNMKREMFDAAVVGSEGQENTRELIIRALGLSPVK